MMTDAEKRHMQAALERAKAPKRPAGLDGASEAIDVPAQPDDGWERPERVEHTSEKEHPPGKG